MKVFSKTVIATFFLLGNVDISYEDKEYDQSENFSSFLLGDVEGWGWRLSFEINSAEASGRMVCNEEFEPYYRYVCRFDGQDLFDSTHPLAMQDETSSCWYELFSKNSSSTVHVEKNIGWTSNYDSYGKQIYKAGWDFYNISNSAVMVGTIRENKIESIIYNGSKVNVVLSDLSNGGRRYYYNNLDGVDSNVTVGDSIFWGQKIGYFLPGSIMEIEIFNKSMSVNDYKNYSKYPYNVVDQQDAGGPIHGVCSVTQQFN